MRFFFICFFSFFPFLLNAQEFDSILISTIAGETCNCLDTIALNTPPEEIDQSMERCLHSAMSAHLHSLVESGIDSPEKGEQVSLEVAKRLLKSCSSFVDFSLLLARQEHQHHLAEQYAEGKLLTYEENDLRYLVIRSKGLEQKFLFFRPFQNAELILKNFERFQGKLVRVGWSTLEFYHPRRHTFTTVREIVSLNIIE